MPPKTTLDNYLNVPHLEQLLLWFLNNDKQISLVSSPAINHLFKEGYLPQSFPDNNPELLKEAMEDITVERWLVIRTWLDLIAAKTISEEENKQLVECLEARIDSLDKYGEKTLISTGTISHKYNLDPNMKDIDTELKKIPTLDEKEKFKLNYLADTLTAAEIRLLAWIYKELFNKEYKIKTAS